MAIIEYIDLRQDREKHPISNVLLILLVTLLHVLLRLNLLFIWVERLQKNHVHLQFQLVDIFELKPKMLVKGGSKTAGSSVVSSVYAESLNSILNQIKTLKWITKAEVDSKSEIVKNHAFQLSTQSKKQVRVISKALLKPPVEKIEPVIKNIFPFTTRPIKTVDASVTFNQKRAFKPITTVQKNHSDFNLPIIKEKIVDSIEQIVREKIQQEHVFEPLNQKKDKEIKLIESLKVVEKTNQTVSGKISKPVNSIEESKSIAILWIEKKIKKREKVETVGLIDQQHKKVQPIIIKPIEEEQSVIEHVLVASKFDPEKTKSIIRLKTIEPVTQKTEQSIPIVSASVNIGDVLGSSRNFINNNQNKISFGKILLMV